MRASVIAHTPIPLRPRLALIHHYRGIAQPDRLALSKQNCIVRGISRQYKRDVPRRVSPPEARLNPFCKHGSGPVAHAAFEPFGDVGLSPADSPLAQPDWFGEGAFGNHRIDRGTGEPGAVFHHGTAQDLARVGFGHVIPRVLDGERHDRTCTHDSQLAP